MIGGVDPDFHRRDLADAIESGALPEWDLGVQVFPDTADQMFEGIDLLDPTKIVPEELAPVQILGTMTLTANPTNYFAELGGPNFSQIPVNRPHADVNEMYRDGMHQSAVHEGVAPYKPNSLDGRLPTVATAEEGALVDPAVQMDGYAVRTASQTFSDHFSQPRMFLPQPQPCGTRSHGGRLHLRVEQVRTDRDPAARRRRPRWCRRCSRPAGRRRPRAGR